MVETKSIMLALTPRQAELLVKLYLNYDLTSEESNELYEKMWFLERVIEGRTE